MGQSRCLYKCFFYSPLLVAVSQLWRNSVDLPEGEGQTFNDTSAAFLLGWSWSSPEGEIIQYLKHSKPVQYTEVLDHSSEVEFHYLKKYGN